MIRIKNNYSVFITVDFKHDLLLLNFVTNPNLIMKKITVLYLCSLNPIMRELTTGKYTVLLLKEVGRKRLLYSSEFFFILTIRLFI